MKVKSPKIHFSNNIQFSFLQVIVLSLTTIPPVGMDIHESFKYRIIYTSLFVGCMFTSTCSGGKMIDMYMKGFDALGNVAV